MIFTSACHKERGTVYLRVYDSIGIPSSKTVLTKGKEIPVDGTYYEANDWVGANIVLYDVVFDSITNWDPSMWLLQKTIINENMDSYYGEFERRETDSWYTLVLKYRLEKSDVEEHWYPGLYHIIYSYIDDSDLIYSPHE